MELDRETTESNWSGVTMTDKKVGTLLTHISSHPEKYDGAVNIPVHRASTMIFKTFEEFENRPKPPFTYGRAGTPTSAAFEQAINALEGAAGSVSTCSGLSAIVVALTSIAGSGDHVLIPDNAYGPNRKFCERMLRHCGVEVDFYAPMIEDISKLFKPNTRALFIEAPGSLTFEVADIGAFVKAAKAAGVKTIMDNSWSTPLLFRPFDHGIDVSVMSCTKYISGHSDAMLGVVSGTAETYPRLKAAAMQLGVCAGSEELYNGLRGLRTLQVRLKEHQARGLDMAQWLAAQPAIKRVLHPALPSCRGHENWKKYFTGACSTFGLVLHETDKKKFARMLDGFELFHMGASWGGYESLCFPEQPGPVRTAEKWAETGLSLRLHIGFEDMDDLKKDLSNGFKRLAD
jgi:cystathionine beta-lyase